MHISLVKYSLFFLFIVIHLSYQQVYVQHYWSGMVIVPFNPTASWA